MAQIHIIGKNDLQNNLLLNFLTEKIGFGGYCSQRLESKSPIYKNESISIQLLLVDSEKFDIKELLAEIDSWRSSIPSKGFAAFYNVDPTMKIEKMALTNNIQGLFYKEDPPDVINKGVSAILKGDLWYSRTSLKKYIMESNSSSVISEHVGASNLTFRERDVLALIAAGSSNKTISDRLCISIHTVKNHICNIYRKINVSNRLQAAFWAAKYL
jgi:DNA-binding NarL/FixJ family response regulator